MHRHAPSAASAHALARPSLPAHEAGANLKHILWTVRTLAEAPFGASFAARAGTRLPEALAEAP